MKLYLDTCVWCRPFDYPEERILVESDAFLEVLRRVNRDFEIIGSAALLAEIEFISSREKRGAVEALIRKACSKILRIDEETAKLAERIMAECRINAMDAVHIAIASRYSDIFVTVDDELLKKSGCLKKFIDVKNVVDVICYEE